MKNIRLHIEYDGFDFHGWQRQLDKPTVQSNIEDVLATILKRRTHVHGASRTDSGVHARGQVANFYTDRENIPAERWGTVLNFYLPRTIRIIESREVHERFHSQRHARSKIYEYRILNRNSASALDRRVLFYPAPLDWDSMKAALPLFVGEKDFKGFEASGGTVITTVRHVYSFELVEESPGLYCFRIEGNGFLKQMVRNIIGTLLEVGEGKRTFEEVEAVFASRDRRTAGRTAPAHGLCLVSVQYDV